MSEEIALQENETMERTIEVNIERNGLGVDSGQVFPSVTVDFAPIVAPASVYWDNIQDKPQFAAVATSGSYNDLSDKPDLSTKQDTLVSGTNIKTVNNESLLGSGNIIIQGGSEDAVLYTEQSLTSEQQTQARENISAGTSNFSGSYNDLSNKPTIPTKTSDLSNDSGFISQETDPTVPSWAKQQNKPSYDYSEIGNTPTIPTVPTNVSAFTNDAGYLTQHQDISNYIQKSQTAGLIKNDGTIDTTQYGTYSKPANGIPASDLASGVIPTVPVQDVTVGGNSVVNNGTAVIPSIPNVPTISTNISSDASDDTKTASPKAVKTYVDNICGDIQTILTSI